jgi:hypothetical protein
MNSIDVVIHSKLAELAVRHGLHPCSFIANVVWSEDRDGPVLNFEIGPADEKKHPIFERMLDAIGVDDNGEFHAKDYTDIYDAIESAIRRAPKLRVVDR